MQAQPPPAGSLASQEQTDKMTCDRRIRDIRVDLIMRIRLELFDFKFSR